MAAGVQGNEIEPAGADAISEVHNMLPDARSEEKSAVAELSSECCKSATDAQPEEKPAVAGLSTEVNSVSAEVHCDDIEAAVAAASPHYIVEHGMDVGVEAEALDMMGAPAKQERIPVDLGAVAPPLAPRVVTAQLIGAPRRARPGDSSKRCETIKGDMQSVFHGGGFLQKRRSRSQLICTTVPCRKEHSPSPSSPQAWASVVAVSRYRFIRVRRPCCHLHPLQRALAAKPSPSVGRTFHIRRECTLDTAAISAKSSNTVLFVCRVCFSVLRFICS